MDGGNGTGDVLGLVVDAPFFTCTLPARQVMKQGAMETNITSDDFPICYTDGLLSAVMHLLCI